MNDLLNHLSEIKLEELELMTELLSKFKEVEMVVLLGAMHGATG